MPASAPALVVIACPNCGTRYQLDYEAIGPKGRSVQCAHCGQSWQAHAEAPVVAPPPPPPVIETVAPDKAFGVLAEEMLDEKFAQEEQRHKSRREASARAEIEERAARAKAKADAVAAAAAKQAADAETAARAAAIAKATAGTVAATAEGAAAEKAAAGEDANPDYQRTLEEIRAAITPKAPDTAALDPASRRRQQQEFSRRQRDVNNKLPIARVRRAVRFAALGALVLLLGGGTILRGVLVEQFPQLAGLYAAVGLGVNVVGLEFRDVHTLLSLQQGSEVLVVDGKIASASNQEADVPQVIVTLLGSDGGALYEWSMTPKATQLEPGESIGFETQLSKPPAGAKDVKLTFANARTQSGISGTLLGAPTQAKVTADASPAAGTKGAAGATSATTLAAGEPADATPVMAAPTAPANTTDGKAGDGQNSTR